MKWVKLFTVLLLIFWCGVLVASLLRPKENPVETIPAMKPARFYETLSNNRVQCGLCFHKCVIPDGKYGFCRVRKNQGGKLFTLVYGRPAGLQSDPIEMEPMYHMIPGHLNLGVYTASCNFRCKQCHNWSISQRGPNEVKTMLYSPAAVVDEAIRRGSRSISYTINEPTVFYEYMYDIAKIARQKGLLNVLHTNGGISPAPLRELLKYIDGVVVDLKSFSDKTYREIYGGRLDPVLQTLKIVREEGVWLEIVNLVIPTVNDCMKEIRAMSKWIVENLGKNVPLHFSRFQPAYRLTHLPRTPVTTLENARQIARSEGINFSTLGNVPGHKFNSTFCPACNKKLIHRVGSSVMANNIRDGGCKSCGVDIPGIWQ